MTVNFSLTDNVTLRVTDTKGVVSIVSEAVIRYAGTGSTAVTAAASSNGIRIYQGDAQVTLKWSEIDTVTFPPRTTGVTADRVSGLVLMKSGELMTCDFVVPAAPGGLRAKVSEGEFLINLADVAQISPVAPLSK